MNMHLKPELLAPQFPMMHIVLSSVAIDVDMVDFTLQYGLAEIECRVQANQLSDQTFVNATSDPQNDVDMPYTRLEVSTNMLIEVMRYDVDLVDGQKIMLTEQQVEVLNKQLEALCIESLEMEMAA